ncbi:hypothetical protein KEU06_25670 [Pseudaminobacter sp. 19-2017]|uniref:Uncharacterized protein n=1 Tax=Pseudaminobacter soli (ex Zhang et al. 2022) TaxID=2831468 RepID=A0A942E6F5_9HYPH|nr:hypothetical protein [Pseudaminobacter soli]MBS3651998.1 hypothetical protein [Pseudaminobacter soli]
MRLTELRQVLSGNSSLPTELELRRLCRRATITIPDEQKADDLYRALCSVLRAAELLERQGSPTYYLRNAALHVVKIIEEERRYPAIPTHRTDHRDHGQMRYPS